MQATLQLRCAHCYMEVEQKASLSIISAGTFDFEIDPCFCGSRAFELRLVGDEDYTKITPRSDWFGVINHTK